MPVVNFQDLGLIDYGVCEHIQQDLFNKSLTRKKTNRDKPVEDQEPSDHHLLFCEHHHVYTLGKSGKESHLLVNNEMLKAKGATFYKINRGGDITYHGPGQIVGYPIFDLECFFTDIHLYMRSLEEAIIITLSELGISAGRINGLTGVWLGDDKTGDARKICALGVKCSRWVTMHGFALNVNTDLSYFNNIIPCGIEGKAVTSIQKESGKNMDMEKVKNILKLNLANVFDYDYVSDYNKLSHP